MTLQFDEELSGNYLLELINTSGQVLQKKTVTLSSGSLVNLVLDHHPAKGLYFIRASNTSQGKQFITKLLIE